MLFHENTRVFRSLISRPHKKSGLCAGALRLRLQPYRGQNSMLFLFRQIGHLPQLSAFRVVPAANNNFLAATTNYKEFHVWATAEKTCLTH